MNYFFKNFAYVWRKRDWYETVAEQPEIIFLKICITCTSLQISVNIPLEMELLVSWDRGSETTRDTTRTYAFAEVK